MNNSFLTEEKISRLFYKYLFPAIMGTLVTSIYILADTIVIGKGIGSDALAALNIILPVFNIFFGIGLLFGVGGSVLMSVARGRGDTKKGELYFTTSLLLNLVTSLIITLLLWIYLDPLCAFLGATEVTMPYIHAYAPYVILGLSAFSISSFLQTFVRNDGAPKLAMTGVVVGGVLNIILDIVFVYPLQMGMGGAAMASVIGALTTTAILVIHFFSKGNGLKLCFREMSFSVIFDIYKTGFVSFIIEICTGGLIFIFNKQLLHYTGECGVSVFGVISNIAIIVTCLCSGITQAAQPIVSTNYGAGLVKRIRQLRRLGIYTSIAICSIFTIIGLIVPNCFTYIFLHPDEAVLSLSSSAIRIYFTGFVLMGINMFIIGYMQAVLQPQKALILCLLRGFVMSAGLVLLLPLFLGVTGIWLAVPLAEFFTLIISAIFIKKTDRSF